MIKNLAVENLNQLREQTKMSRVDLLAELKKRGITMHQTTLRRIEEGTQPMKLNEAIALADVFRMPLQQFCFEAIDVDRANLQQALLSFEKQLDEIRWNIEIYEEDRRHLKNLVAILMTERPEIELLPEVHSRLHRASEIEPYLREAKKLLGHDLHESLISDEVIKRAKEEAEERDDEG